MANQLLFQKEDTLASTMTAGATSATLTSGNFTFTASGQQYLVIDYDVPAKAEVVLATVSGTSLTSVTRAQDGTSAVEHAAGAKVGMMFVPSHYNSIANLNAAQYSNILDNGNFINNSTNGYGSTPDDWTNSSANPVQGGFPVISKDTLLDELGLADGDLEALYTLNNVYTDLSSNAYTLTASGSPTFSDDGMMAKALDLEASSSQYATGAAANAKLTGSQTWFALIKPESVSGGNFNIMGFRDSDGTEPKFLSILTSGKVEFNLNGLSTDRVSSDVILQAGKWYMVTGVYDSANSLLKIWVNGIKKQTSSSGSSGQSTSNNLSIGRHGDQASDYYDGLIQYAGVLSTALTDAQVKRLWSLLSYQKVKIRRNGSNGYLSQDLRQDVVNRLQGKTVTLSCEYYQDTASIGQIDINGTASTTSSTVNTWLPTSVTTTLDAAVEGVTIKLNVKTSNGNVWFRNVTLNEGATALPYTHSPNDYTRFPALLRLDPPPVISGYEFEEGKWFNYTPTIAQGASTDISKTIVYSKFVTSGKTITYSFRVSMTAAGTGGSTVTVTVPASISQSEGVLGIGEYFDSGTASYVTRMTISTSAAVFMAAASVTATGASIGANPSLAVASGDVIQGNITYEVA